MDKWLNNILSMFYYKKDMLIDNNELISSG